MNPPLLMTEHQITEEELQQERVLYEQEAASVSNYRELAQKQLQQDQIAYEADRRVFEQKKAAFAEQKRLEQEVYRIFLAITLSCFI